MNRERVEVSEKTYTLKELIGEYPDWWHMYPGFPARHGAKSYCGLTTFNASAPYVNALLDGQNQYCPECKRIERERGGR